MKRVRFLSVICLFLLPTFTLAASNVNELFPNAVNDFGLRLMKQLCEDSPDENIVISPVSISLALSMAMNGAEGETLQEMKEVLGYGDAANYKINTSAKWLQDKYLSFNTPEDLGKYETNTKLHLANSIWYTQDATLRESFNDMASKYFDGEIYKANFAQEDSLISGINEWVSRETKGTIPNIINSVHPDAIMYLLNSIYFKAGWRYPFREKNTRNDVFYLNGNIKYDCRMMANSQKTLYYENNIFQSVRLAYDHNLYMAIYLPKKTHSTIQVVSYLSDEKYKEVHSDYYSALVHLKLPKFETSGSIDLKEKLQSMGMTKCFTPLGEFSHLFYELIGYIHQVKHKGFIKVCEKGTEASAVTMVVEVMAITPKPTEVDMIVNRPFVFAISDRHTNAIMFLGKVMKPEWND